MDAEMRAIFEDGLERFRREHYSHYQWRMYGQEEHGFDPSLWSEMATLGWLGLIDGAGGIGGGIGDLVPLLGAAGRGLWREPLRSVLGEVAGVLLTADYSQGIAAELLRAVTEGGQRPAFAHREFTTGWHAAPLSTVATRVSGAYRITGEKAFVEAADSATSLIVTAVIEASGEFGVFLVEGDAVGFKKYPFRTLDDRRAARITFEDAPVQLLGRGERGVECARRRGAVLAGAETFGVIQAANRATAEHLKNRKQFGRPIGSFQVLQHRLVEMYLLERESEAMLMEMARVCDAETSDLDQRLLIHRAQIAAAGRYVTQEAIQMHGGMGMTSELPIGDYYKRVLMLESLYGSADWALEQLAA